MASTDGLILIIDDNVDLLDVIATSLSREGYQVCTAENGVSGLEMVRQHDPDLVILDIMMPVLSGWGVLQRLREFSTVPIIILTVLGREHDIVRGLQSGADDYIVKPFSNRELLGRVRARLRRAEMATLETVEPPFAVGDLVLDPSLHQVTVGDRVIKLTFLEFRLLSSLARRAGALVPRQQLLQEVWGKDYHADTRHLKVYIHYLRKKLEDDLSNPQYIISERGEGYRLVI
jgi:DNA-binding response OmpR family regulator